MLLGVNPMLNGELLLHLDAMGHGDTVCVADANFPAARLATRLVDLPTVASPAALAAVRTMLPPDDGVGALALMQTPDGARLPIMDELLAAARLDDGLAERLLDRFDFYAAAADAYLVIRTGETRIYGNALFRKGVVQAAGQ